MRRAQFLILVVSIVISCECIALTMTAEHDGPTVSLRYGDVMGQVLNSYNGNDYYAFKAIPYAKPPVGQRKFQPPEPLESWEGVFHATELGPECPQYNFVTKGVEGNEDCLRINVYTPQIPKGSSNANLPVLAFIHGGAFLLGSGIFGIYGPQKLIDYGVVLVTFNYRLGIFGFLNTEDSTAPGNYGMLDQVLALRWIQENVAQFGGDPGKVTIFGESAGAASVIYHLISPLSKGLFHRAISQSGSALNKWALNRQPLKWAKQIAQIVKCPTNDSVLLVNCLRERSYRDVIRAQRSLQLGEFQGISAAPSVDGPGGQGFLPGDPMSLIKTGQIANKVPLIIGTNELEMLGFHKDYANSLRSKTGSQYFVDEFVHFVCDYYPSVEPHMTAVLQKIRDEYLKCADTDPISTVVDDILRLQSDLVFGLGISQTADYLADNKLPVWSYFYTHTGRHSFTEIFGSPGGNQPATHGDELFLLFSFFYTQLEKMTENDSKMSSILNTLWTDFAKGKNLTEHQLLSWTQYNSEDKNHLVLNLNPAMAKGPLCEKVNFWTSTVPTLIKYYSAKEEL